MAINMKEIKDNESAVYPNLLESGNIYSFWGKCTILNISILKRKRMQINIDIEHFHEIIVQVSYSI